MYFCDQCIKVYCVSCEVEYHTGMTCEQYKRLHEEKNEDAILEYNLGRLSYKPCPKCRAPIDKYAGCNAVKCTLCSIQFCWRCQATDEIDSKCDSIKYDLIKLRNFFFFFLFE
jgi:hypothetical protein